MIDLASPCRLILQGDALERLREIPSQSIDVAIKSPPYWGLRDYGVPGQLGLEPTWREHLDALMPIYREIDRVLKPTGSDWTNYGDTVVQSSKGTTGSKTGLQGSGFSQAAHDAGSAVHGVRKPSAANGPRKHKLGLHWRLRFKLNDELGWISRSDVVWHKPNQMPLAMKDRVTPKYEMVFHFVKQQRYFFDLDAIRTPFSEAMWARVNQPSSLDDSGGPKDYSKNGTKGSSQAKARRNLAALIGDPPRAWTQGLFTPGNDPSRFEKPEREGRAPLKWGAGVKATDAEIAAYREDSGSRVNGRNKTLGADGTPLLRRAPEGAEHEERGAFHPLGANPGDVWTIATQPIEEAHFATYPEELVRRIVLASCPERVCTNCGEAWRRTYSKSLHGVRGRDRGSGARESLADQNGSHKARGQGMVGAGAVRVVADGWEACECKAPTRPGIVLDPFFGSGTTGKVAAELGRDFVGIELNPKYVRIARRRLGPLLTPLTSFKR